MCYSLCICATADTAAAWRVVTASEVTCPQLKQHALAGHVPGKFITTRCILLQLCVLDIYGCCPQIDAIDRKQRKEHATTNWARTNAAAADLDFSGDECSDDDEAKPAQRVADARSIAQLTALKAQLQQTLATPLQPSISHRYFTGGMSSLGVAAAATARPAAGAGDMADGAAEHDEDGSVVRIAAVNKTLKLAARLNHARTDANGRAAKSKGVQGRKAAAQNSKQAIGGKGQKKGGQGPHLSKLLMSRNEMKRQRRRGLVVVGGQAAFGRDLQAPNALQALRNSQAQ